MKLHLEYNPSKNYYMDKNILLGDMLHPTDAYFALVAKLFIKNILPEPLKLG